MVNLKFMFDSENACCVWLEMEFSDRWVYVSITPLFQIKMMMSPPAPHHLHLQQVGSHDDPFSSNHCCFFTNVVEHVSVFQLQNKLKVALKIYIYGSIVETGKGTHVCKNICT